MTDMFEQQLRRFGIQVTAQRLAVMKAVASRPHATADELTEAVRASIGSISRQAVYDALSLLVDKKMIRRIHPGGSSARYEDRIDDNHHHLICRECGKTIDLDTVVGAVPNIAAADAQGFEIEEAEVIFWGRCPECRQREGQPASNPPRRKRDK